MEAKRRHGMASRTLKLAVTVMVLGLLSMSLVGGAEAITMATDAVFCS
jgi:hypothetical protein